MNKPHITRFDAINRIINFHKLKNPVYLEIGVWTGETFKNINSHKPPVNRRFFCFLLIFINPQNDVNFLR